MKTKRKFKFCSWLLESLFRKLLVFFCFYDTIHRNNIPNSGRTVFSTVQCNFGSTTFRISPSKENIYEQRFHFMSAYQLPCIRHQSSFYLTLACRYPCRYGFFLSDLWPLISHAICGQKPSNYLIGVFFFFFLNSNLAKSFLYVLAIVLESLRSLTRFLFTVFEIFHFFLLPILFCHVLFSLNFFMRLLNPILEGLITLYVILWEPQQLSFPSRNHSNLELSNMTAGNPK